MGSLIHALIVLCLELVVALPKCSRKSPPISSPLLPMCLQFPPGVPHVVAIAISLHLLIVPDGDHQNHIKKIDMFFFKYVLLISVSE